MAEHLPQLTPPQLTPPQLTLRQQAQLLDWAVELQAAPNWVGNLPVALLERCWLRLRRISLEQLALVLPPDASAEAPELVRYRAWIAAGQPAWSAQLRCWQEFGQPACQGRCATFGVTRSEATTAGRLLPIWSCWRPIETSFNQEPCGPCP